MIGNRLIRRNRSTFIRPRNEFSGRRGGGSQLLKLLLVAGLALGGWLYLRDLRPPTVAMTPAAGALSPRKPLLLELADSGRGVRALKITVSQGGQEQVLLEKSYPAGTAAQREELNLTSAKLVDGPCDVRVEVRDHALFPLFNGNRQELKVPFVIDSVAPTVTVESGTTNFTQGGSGAIVFSASEELAAAGIKVGDAYFPAFRQPSGLYLCFLAFSWNLPEAAFIPKIVASDRAGNERITGIYFRSNARTFPTDRLQVSRSFLENKIVPDFQPYFPEISDPLALFLKVNRELRKENLAEILKIGQITAPTPLWQGTFQRLPKAAVPGFFAQNRTYIADGRVVDHQTHLGIDLASTAQAEVPAANTGKVVFAGDLGIYGECVIIDHGVNVQTLYAHLSRIDVKPGETVQKGQGIARTGTTGLAGGDHLHFDVLVAGRQVNPLEWWDTAWLENNVNNRLRQAGY
jgi:murein DD-endopeptidase MepM/ murein hydrolase activator NlpD